MPRRPPAALRSALQGARRLAEQPRATNGDGLEATATRAKQLIAQLMAASGGVAFPELVAMEVPLALALVARRLLEDLQPLLEDLSLLEAAAGSADTPGSGGSAACARAAALGAEVSTQAEAIIRTWPVTFPQSSRIAAAAAQQVVSTGLAPALQAAMERVAAAVLNVDDATLTARAAAQPRMWLLLAQGLLCWFTSLVHVWGEEAILGSPVSGPLALPAVRLLLAEALLGGRMVEQHVAGGALRPFADDALVCDAFTFCSWGARFFGDEWRHKRASVAQHPYIEQLWRSQAYLRAVACAMVLQACVLMQTGSNSSQGGQGGGSAGLQQLQQLQQQQQAQQQEQEQQEQAAVDVLQQLVRMLGLPECLASHLAVYPGHERIGIYEFQECAQELSCIAECLHEQECAPVARQALGVLAPLPALLLIMAARFGGADLDVVQWVPCAASDVLRVLSLHQGGVDVAQLRLLLAHTVSLLEQAAAAISSSSKEMQEACVAGAPFLFNVLAYLEPEVRLRAPDVAELAAWGAVAARLAAAVESVLRSIHMVDCAACTLGSLLGAVDNFAISAWVMPEVPGAAPLLRAVSRAPLDGAEQQQFFAMLVTARKLFPRVARAYPQAVEGFVTNVMFGACCLHVAGSIRGASGSSGGSDGHSSRSGSSQSAAPQLPWLALLAQAMQLAGTLLQAGLSGGEAGETPTAAVSRCALVCAGAVAGLQFMCRHVLRAGTEQPAVTAGAAAAAWPDVQPHLQQLQQQLLPLVQQGRGLLSQAVTAMRQQNSAATAAGSGNDCSGGPAVVDATVEAAPTAVLEAALAGLDPALLPAAVACSDAEVLRMLQRSFVATLPAQLLESAGALSAALPNPYCCNNPGCSNLATASELALVGGKRCVCTGCRTARYCGEACQAAHWPHHKPVCRRLRRAAAAVAPV